MSFGLNNDAEVALLKKYFDVNSVEMGLYYDFIDDFSDTNLIEDITTEPTGSNYSRKTVNPEQMSVSSKNGSGVVDMTAQTFNVSDSSQRVDAAFLYNPEDEFVLRLEIDTTDYTTDYIPTEDLDNLRLGGETLILE